MHNWKPVPDLAYNRLYSAGNVPTMTAPTAERGAKVIILNLRQACRDRHFPSSKRSSSSRLQLEMHTHQHCAGNRTRISTRMHFGVLYNSADRSDSR